MSTANPGSLVVWSDGVSPGRTLEGDEFVVYDTGRRTEVARLPFTGAYNDVLGVDANHVFFNPDNRTPGCWVWDVQACSNPHLFSYDVASGSTRKITAAEHEAEVGTQSRMLVLIDQGHQTVFTATGTHFRQQQRLLIPTDANGDDTVLTRPGGEKVQVRLPAGYTAANNNFALAQWLDDDRVVLWADQGPDEFGFGDSYHAGFVDLLVCRLPNGVCHIAVRASKRPYLPAG